MAAFLFTWNPGKFNSWDDLAWIMRHRRSSWSCGSRKSIPPGSRIYLLKQGSPPRGLVASGYSAGDVYPDLHWIPARRKKREKTNYVRVNFDTVLGPDPASFLPTSSLKQGRLRRVYWRTQMSGMQIPPEAESELERIWKKFVKGEAASGGKRPITAIENTLTEVSQKVRKRDRGLQELAKLEAQGVCESCETDFGSLLDGLGLRALQVHHRRQLAATNLPRTTRLRDLAVVCANCHAMIHANPKRALPVAELRRKLRRADS